MATGRSGRAAAGWAALTLGLAALALAISGLDDAGAVGARAVAARATGVMSLVNVGDGEAVLNAANLKPGAAVRGSVEIRNAGDETGSLTLSPRNLSDLPGPNGGTLSAALILTVRDITGGSDAIVYSGPLGRMPERNLGALGAGESREYRFRATLPDGGIPRSATTGDNAFAGSRTSLDYRWTLAMSRLEPCATLLLGDGRPNRLIGTLGGDRIAGRGGRDVLAGRDGDDCLGGGDGRDEVSGGAGDDRVTGARGTDRLAGGPGRDRVNGNGGDDVIAGGHGRDRLLGGIGNDLLRARDGAADAIDCGPGRHDLVIVDRRDVTRRCEQLGGFGASGPRGSQPSPQPARHR